MAELGLVIPCEWLRPDMVPPAPFLQCKPHLTPGVLGFLLILPGLMRNSERLGFPIFVAPGQREASLEEFAEEVMVGCLWFLRSHILNFLLRCLLMLFDVKVLPVAWYDQLARIISQVEETGVWPDGLPDAIWIAMIPQADGDAAPLGQRPLSGSRLSILLGFCPDGSA